MTHSLQQHAGTYFRQDSTNCSNTLQQQLESDRLRTYGIAMKIAVSSTHPTTVITSNSCFWQQRLQKAFSCTLTESQSAARYGLVSSDKLAGGSSVHPGVLQMPSLPAAEAQGGSNGDQDSTPIDLQCC